MATNPDLGPISRLVPDNIEIFTGPVPTYYVEGVSQFSLGSPVCRLMFHSSTISNPGEPDSPQQRQLAVELVMPLGSLLELTKAVHTTIIDNLEAYSHIKAEQENRLRALLADLQQQAKKSEAA